MAIYAILSTYALLLMLNYASCFTSYGILSTDQEEFNITVTPNELEELHWKHTENILINITCPDTGGTFALHIRSQDENVAMSEGFTTESIQCIAGERTEVSFDVTIRGVFLGVTTLDIYLEANISRQTISPAAADSPHLTYHAYPVRVVNYEGALSRVFIVVVALLIVVLNLGFGCKIDLGVAKAILRWPLPPLIGMGCQFVVMPLLGCALTFALHMEPGLGFGVLVTACSPGGGGSNVWTYLLGGDIDLSITMTLCSKAIALATMPLWMFALGRLYLEGTTIQIPYANIIYGLLSIVVPCFVGLMVAKYRPAAARRISRAIKPLSCVFILWVMVVGSVTNPYVYVLMARYWYIIPAGLLLPLFGMLLGYALARLCRQGNKRALTIAIETGIQDTGIAIILLLASFDKPYGDFAATLAITSAMLTPLPLLAALGAATLYRRCWLGGRCRCLGGPEKLLLDDLERVDDEEGDAVSTTNTKTSELTPKEEKDNHLDALREDALREDALMEDAHARGDGLMANDDTNGRIANGHA